MPHRATPPLRVWLVVAPPALLQNQNENPTAAPPALLPVETREEFDKKNENPESPAFERIEASPKQTRQSIATHKHRKKRKY